jgi:23S rRNA (pseudouridine1915-N3)-methyltransferase
VRLTIACVGRPRAYAAEAVQDYLDRIARFAPVRLVPVRAERDADRDPVVARRREGERLLGAIPKGATVVALDARGQSMTSEAFSTELCKLADQGTREVAFLVGGPVGLSEEVLQKSGRVLSLSAMTLAHEIALVVLCEQIYRALAIARGHPYHK